MSRLVNTELNHFGGFIKQAMTVKEKSNQAHFLLKDGAEAILLYQSVSDEIKKVIDDIFLHLCDKHFNTLALFYLKDVLYQESKVETGLK